MTAIGGVCSLHRWNCDSDEFTVSDEFIVLFAYIIESIPHGLTVVFGDLTGINV